MRVAREVVGAILVKDNAILLGRRSDHKSFAGQWDIVGGHIEAGETAWMALCRELSEEIGIDVIAAEHLKSLVIDADGKAMTLHIYRVSSWRGEPCLRNDEHSELRWFDTGAACRITTIASPLYRPIFATLRT